MIPSRVLLSLIVSWVMSSDLIFGQITEVVGQTSASVRWTTEVDRSRPADVPGSHVLFGPQEAFFLGVSLENSEGPAVTSIGRLADLLKIEVQDGGVTLPIEVQVQIRDFGQDDSSLDPGEGVHVRITVTPNRTGFFPIGEFAVTVDLTAYIDALRLEDGARWSGRAKVSERRKLLVKEIVTDQDRRDFYTIEGNYSMWLGDYARAATFLEPLVRLAPDDWWAHGALGQAYLSTRRYKEAADVLERALPGWLRFGDVRSRLLVPNNLAHTYIALGREADAFAALRRGGLSEADAAARLEVLRAYHR